MRDEQLVAVARWQLEARQLRYRDFPSSLFDEHAWDMLLQLFVDRQEGRTTTLTSLAPEVGGSPRACERWLRHLMDEGEVAEDDGGHLSLTDKGMEQLRHYLQSAAPLLESSAQAIQRARTPGTDEDVPNESVKGAA